MASRGVRLQPGAIPTQQDNGGTAIPTTLTSQQLAFLTSKVSTAGLKQFAKEKPDIGVAAGVGGARLASGGIRGSQYATGGTTQRLLDVVEGFRGRVGTVVRPHEEETFAFNLTPEEQAEEERTSNLPPLMPEGLDVPTGATPGPGYQRDLGPSLGSQFVGGANPFDGPSRGNYAASTMLPQNLNESRLSREYLKNNRVVVWFEPATDINYGGSYKVIRNGITSDATSTEIAQAEFQTQMIEQINDLNLRAFEFVEAEQASRRTQDEANAAAVLARERDQFLSDLRVQEKLNPEILAQKEKEVETDFQNAIAEIKQEGVQRRLDLEIQGEQKRQTSERQFELDIAVQKSEQDFAAAQSALDRELQALNLEEAQRQALVVEQMDRQRQSLAEKQFKMEIFSFLSASPEMLYFMQQDENLSNQFNSLLADVDESGTLSEATQSLIKTIQARPTLNIQQFSRLTRKEKGIERFSQAGQTGTTKENVEAGLLGQAPVSPTLPPSGETLQRLRI
jgi:hypothetical protein